jgi:hypothetical protein
MITAEENQNRANSRREKEQPVFREGIGVKQPITVTDANTILSSLVVPIQGSEVNIGRRLVDVNIPVRGTEYTSFALISRFSTTTNGPTCG